MKIGKGNNSQLYHFLFLVFGNLSISFPLASPLSLLSGLFLLKKSPSCLWILLIISSLISCRCSKKIVEVDVLSVLTMVAPLVVFHFAVGYLQSLGPSTNLVVTTAVII